MPQTKCVKLNETRVRFQDTFFMSSMVFEIIKENGFMLCHPCIATPEPGLIFYKNEAGKTVVMPPRQYRFIKTNDGISAIP
jgi:hypothetical protein